MPPTNPDDLFSYAYNQLLPIYGALESLVIANIVCDYAAGKPLSEAWQKPIHGFTFLITDFEALKKEAAIAPQQS